MGAEMTGFNGWALLALALLVVAMVMFSLFMAERYKHKYTQGMLEDACTGVMTMNAYQALAMRTAAPQEPNDAMDHALFGLGSEVGELMTHWKAHRYYGKPLSREYMVKELGDVLWFLNRAAVAQLITLDEVARTNIDKLRQRYPGKFSRQAALERADEHADVTGRTA